MLLPFTSSSRTTSASSPKITYYLSEQASLNYETDISIPSLVSCGSSGSSCEDACYNASLCAMENATPTIVSCYFPDFGEVCCPDGSGYSCGSDQYCALDDYGDTYCCELSQSLESCAFYVNASLIAETNQPTTETVYITGTPTSFSIPEPSGSTLSTRFTMIHSGTDLPADSITSTSKRPTQTFTVLAQPSSSSSSSSMSTGTKVGIGIGVPAAVLGLGLIAAFAWFRRRQQKDTNAEQPPWEVDAQESQLTAEELERKRNKNPFEDHDPDRYIEVPQDTGNPRAAQMRENSERPDDAEVVPLMSGGLAVSPVSPNMNSAGASPSLSLPLHRSISPIPTNFLGEFSEHLENRREGN